MSNHISILDTTLRDGEQTPDVCFDAEQKLRIAQALLTRLGVDRIEIGSARTSKQDHTAFAAIGAWAFDQGHEDRVEILAFADHQQSIDWLGDIPYKTLGILCKGSRVHCEQQLGKPAQAHFDDVRRTIEYALAHGKSCNIFLEDWSQGIAQSPDYIAQVMETIKPYPVMRVYLCDTLGILGPTQTRQHVNTMLRDYPDTVFELHCHNDYGLAIANYLAAIECGIRGFHVTVNGLGERAGNAALEEFAVAVSDLTECRTQINQSALMEVAHLVEHCSKRPIARNKPIIGSDVFTHTSGVHADGQKKGALYTSRLDPARFGRQFDYALGKLSGISNLDHHLERMNVSLSEPERRALIDMLKNEPSDAGEPPLETIRRIIGNRSSTAR